MDEAENQINDLKEKKKKQSEQEEDKRIPPPQKEGSISSLWEFKHSNICIIGVPEGEENEQEITNLFEKIMKENFPNLVKEIIMQVQEAQRVPIMMDAKRPTPRYIKI